MKVGEPQRGSEIFLGPFGAESSRARLSHVKISPWEHHLQDDAIQPFPKALPHGFDVACWLMQLPWRPCLPSASPPLSGSSGALPPGAGMN